MKGIYKYAAMGCPTAKDITAGVIYDTPCEKKIFNKMKIQGTITDEFGTPLSGAHIFNTNNRNASAISDSNGKFYADAQPTDTIEVSYVGFKTLRFQASKIPSIIKMEMGVTELDDVVIIAPKRVVKKPSLKNFIKENQAWIMVGLTIFSIGITIYFSNKKLKK